MLAEYIDMVNCLPTQSSEIGHRVVELLKFFNTRTAQLVLGAGAMQVFSLQAIGKFWIPFDHFDDEEASSACYKVK